MKAHEVRLEQEDDADALLFAKPKKISDKQTKSSNQTKSDKQKQSRKKSDSDDSGSENEKHRRANWKERECSEFRELGHIAQCCAKRKAQAAAVANSTMTTENFWMTDAAAGNIPLKESWYLDSATTSYNCGDQQIVVLYTEYDKSEEREIRDFAGRVAGVAIGYGDVRLMLTLPGSRIDEVVVKNVLHIEGANSTLSQSRLIDRGLLIGSVDGFGVNIYENAVGTKG